MFTKLVVDLKAFVEERDWLVYHTPRNMATTLFVEGTELLEHALPGGDFSRQELEHEMGDVLHCILLTMEALHIEPPKEPIHYQPSRPLFLELSSKLRAFMHHFLWLKEKEEFRGEKSELANILEELLAIHLLLCKEVKMDPIEVTYKKLEHNKKKYPVELIKGSVDKYFKHKKMK